MSVVIVGGTAEARALALILHDAGMDVITTLAGATAQPKALPGRVHTGGFGGDEAMAAWLDEVGATAIVDATHPFAAKMTARMARLSRRYRVLRLNRPGWVNHPDASRWTWVDDHDAAARAAAQLPGRVLLTIGRTELLPYADLGARALARMVSAPQITPACEIILATGPFSPDEERLFFVEHEIAVLVAKDSGGPMSAKLDVARERDCPIIMVRRPHVPDELSVVGDVGAAVAWVHAQR